MNPVLILAIDSSQPVGTVALARAEGEAVIIIDSVQAHGGRFSAQLVPTLKRLLEAHNLRKHDVDVIAAASGPGTFTGLRVGLAAVKALAEALGKPVVLVSVLEAVAAAAPGPGERIAVVSAGKGFWYAGVYGSSVHERHCTREQLQELVAASPGARVATLPAVEDLLIADAQVIEAPVSELVARVAARKAQAGQFVPIDQVDANYVRADDALYRVP